MTQCNDRRSTAWRCALLTLAFTLTACGGGGGGNGGGGDDDAEVTPEYALSVEKAGDGQGSVTSSPSGIDCGGNCSGSFEEGTPVTLQASWASDAKFAGWGGACDSSGMSTTCTVTVDQNTDVSAEFAEDTAEYVLTVDKAGDGQGSVTSSPSGIDCGSDCSAAFEESTEVTLETVAGSDSAFSGWSGACSGTASTCTVNLTADDTATASFEQTGLSDFNALTVADVEAIANDRGADVNDLRVATEDGIGNGSVSADIGNVVVGRISGNPPDSPELDNDFLIGVDVKADSLPDVSLVLYLDMDDESTTGRAVDGIGAEFRVAGFKGIHEWDGSQWVDQMTRFGDSGYEVNESGNLVDLLDSISAGEVLDGGFHIVTGVYNTRTFSVDEGTTAVLRLEEVDDTVGGFVGVIDSTDPFSLDPVDDSSAGPISSGKQPLNDTGIDWCADGSTNYDSGDAVLKRDNCEMVSADYPGQDGMHGRDAAARDGELDKEGDGAAGFDYTKLDADGNDLPAGASEWSCVRDNHTGLIWEVKTDDGGLRDQDNEYTWYQPDGPNAGDPGEQDGGSCTGSDCDTQGFVQAVNDQGLCGATDWRLPTVDELHSVTHLGRTSPAIDEEFFPRTRSSYFWSASPYASAGFYSDYAWSVIFDLGGHNLSGTGVNHRVRLVRVGE